MVIVVDHRAKGNSATQISMVYGTFVFQAIHLLELLVHKILLCHLLPWLTVLTMVDEHGPHKEGLSTKARCLSLPLCTRNFRTSC